MPRILLIQGANMCHLGKREPEFYGTTTAVELDAMLQAYARTGGWSLTSSTPMWRVRR
jgi:3-dehydroquinate dehydratase-2